MHLGLNSVLANLYRGEQDSMGWHADNERELGNDPTIASVSLAATRRFWLKHANAKTVRLELGHGSLLVMQGSTQQHWKHCVPKETSPKKRATERRASTSPFVALATLQYALMPPQLGPKHAVNSCRAAEHLLPGGLPDELALEHACSPSPA